MWHSPHVFRGEWSISLLLSTMGLSEFESESSGPEPPRITRLPHRPEAPRRWSRGPGGEPEGESPRPRGFGVAESEYLTLGRDGLRESSAPRTRSARAPEDWPEANPNPLP